MNRKYITLILVSVFLLTVVSVPSALAYFSTYTQAKGQKIINLKNETEMNETVEGFTKTISIKAKDNSAPVYVRAKAYSPDYINLEYTLGEGWSSLQDDGYFYYSRPLNANEQTSDLKVTISEKEHSTYKPGDEFHVVVIYESILEVNQIEWPVLASLLGGNS